MKTILAIDPGNVQSAYVLWQPASNRPMIESAIVKNEDFLTYDWALAVVDIDIVAIEIVRSYGMSVGQTVFDTCVWIGRFWQMFYDLGHRDIRPIPRLDVKMCICHNGKAKDTNILQALKDRFGEPGTKKNPGILYGVKKDIWSAVAIAVTVADKYTIEELAR